MKTAFSQEKLTSGVISIISDALRIDEGKIKLNSRILKDLKAESIDLLDIRFSIEKQYGLKIGENEIRESVKKAFPGSDIQEKLTVQSIINFVTGKLGKGKRQWNYLV